MKQELIDYADWVAVMDGLTVRGSHLHFYRNVKSGLLDYKVEG